MKRKRLTLAAILEQDRIYQRLISEEDVDWERIDGKAREDLLMTLRGKAKEEMAKAVSEQGEDPYEEVEYPDGSDLVEVQNQEWLREICIVGAGPVFQKFFQSD